MSNRTFRERECIHRQRGAEGAFYNGTAYVQSLERLGAAAAMKMAGNVTSFFWSDAPQITVWLCRGCAVELRMRDGATGGVAAAQSVAQ